MHVLVWVFAGISLIELAILVFLALIRGIQRSDKLGSNLSQYLVRFLPPKLLRRLLSIAVLGFIATVASLILTIYYENRPADLLRVDIVADGKSIAVIDVKGRVVFQKSFGTAVSVAEVSDSQVLVGFKGVGDFAGYVVVYDRRGEILWADNTYDGFPESYPFGATSGFFNVGEILVVDLDGIGGNEILVKASDPTWYVSRILIFSGNGQRIGEYLNPGSSGPILVHDMDGDGVPEVLLRSINNHFGVMHTGDGTPVYVWTATLFSGDDINGIAPLTGDLEREKESSQLWYIITTPVDLETEYLAFDSSMAYSDPQVGFGERDDSGEYSVVVRHPCGYFYYFSKTGELLGTGRSDLTSRDSPNMELYKVTTTETGYLFERIDGETEFHIRLE